MAQEPLQVVSYYAVIYKRKKGKKWSSEVFVDKLMANPRPEEVQDWNDCENILPGDCSTNHQCLGRRWQSGTYFVLIEYSGKEEDSYFVLAMENPGLKDKCCWTQWM